MSTSEGLPLHVQARSLQRATKRQHLLFPGDEKLVLGKKQIHADEQLFGWTIIRGARFGHTPQLPVIFILQLARRWWEMLL